MHLQEPVPESAVHTQGSHPTISLANPLFFGRPMQDASQADIRPAMARLLIAPWDDMPKVLLAGTDAAYARNMPYNCSRKLTKACF